MISLSKRPKGKSIKKKPFFYSYKGVVYGYSFFLDKEVKQMIEIDHTKSLFIVRLDGKRLTKDSNTKELVNEPFYSAMKYIIENIANYCKVQFAYSAGDEISLLIEKDYLEERAIENRMEKVLTYLSGYVSSLFTIGFYDLTGEKRVTSFDARAIIVDKNESKNYFLCRQRISIQHFIEKICNSFGFDRHGYTIKEIDCLLNGKGEKWSQFPRCASYGIVGYYNSRGEWSVEDAKDFESEWYDIPFKNNR